MTMTTATCNDLNRRIFRLGAAFLILAASGSVLQAAFSVDPAEEKRIARGEEPAFLTEIERMDRLGKLGPVLRRPKQELPDTLLAKVIPIQHRTIATASVEPAGSPVPDSAADGEGGTKTWHVVAFLCSLAFAGFAFWRFRRPGPADVC